MEKRISELFDYGDEIAVPEPGADCAPGEIKELTMKKIHREDAGRKAGPGKKVRPVCRTLLIAAAIAALLAGTALAVYQYTIKDALVGEPYVPETDPPGAAPETAETETETRRLLSAVGFSDSPEYQAYVEWENWNRSWQAENPDWFSDRGADDRYYEAPENYARYYNAYSREQAEKLEEIAARYGLALHTDRAFFDTEEELCAMLGMEDIFSGAYRIEGNYVYEDGSFLAEGWAAAGGERVMMNLVLAARGSLTVIVNSIPADYAQRAYVTADGTEVILAQAGGEAYMIAGLEGAYVSAKFHAALTAEALEEMADGAGLAALDGRFAPGADRRVIAPAAEKEPEDPAGTMDEAILEALGDYSVSALPEGYVYKYEGAIAEKEQRSLSNWGDYHDVSMDGMCKAYEGNNGEKKIVIDLLYFRYYDLADMTAVTNEKEFLAEREYYRETDESFRECTVNGYEGFFFVWQDGERWVAWYDTQRELVFNVGGKGIEAVGYSCPFTDEEFIALAESVGP